MHDEISGYCAEIMLISSLKIKKEERGTHEENTSLDGNFLTFHCMSLCVICSVYMFRGLVGILMDVTPMYSFVPGGNRAVF